MHYLLPVFFGGGSSLLSGLLSSNSASANNRAAMNFSEMVSVASSAVSDTDV